MLGITWRFCEKPCWWAPPSELLNSGGAGPEDLPYTKFSSDIEAAYRKPTLWETLGWMKHAAQTLLYVGALWGETLTLTQPGSERGNLLFFFFPVFQVISVPLGSLTNPLLGMIRPEKLKHTDFESNTAQMSRKQFGFSTSVQGKNLKIDFGFSIKFFLHLPHHYSGHSTAVLRSSVDKNAFAHSVRFLPFSKCILGSVYSCALNEKIFKFFYLSKLWCLLPNWVISHKCSQQRIWGHNTIVSIQVLFGHATGVMSKELYNK